MIITSGPGTGKTTTINTIIQIMESEGFDILLAAPTGRAAKRMSETSGMEAQTIHRMLEIDGGSLDDDKSGMHFQRNETKPLGSRCNNSRRVFHGGHLYVICTLKSYCTGYETLLWLVM